MSGLPPRIEEQINGVDVREQGSALRVATNTPHLVSLGTGRYSTAVTLHPIKEGRVTIGSDPTCDIHLVGAGVAAIHCRVEKSHGSVTLYPLGGTTLVDAVPVISPTRLSQGCMLTIGRSNYLRFNHPEEAKLMKSVLPREEYSNTGHQKPEQRNHYHQNPNNQSFKQSDNDNKQSIKSKPKPPVPRKPQLLEIQENDERPKISSIMAKVSKFEYYAKTQQKNSSKSQFYTNDYEISPKVFTSNSVTTNMAAKDVLVNRNAPTNIQTRNNQDRSIFLHENNAIDSKTGSYANVSIRNRTRIDDIVRNFDEQHLPKKVNNDTRNEHVYGKINNQVFHESSKNVCNTSKMECYGVAGKTGNVKKPSLPSPAFDRNPQYSPVYSNSSQFERSFNAENRRVQAYQERIKEEEVKQNESDRLEEILSMCAEYERQASSGTPITPTEKRSHNKIITNGSLPRSVVVNNPNFIQTTDGYYKFDTNHSRNNSLSRSLPHQRNVSSYENYDITQIATYPQNPEEKQGRMDELGIPVYENQSNKNQLSSPILIRKIIEQKTQNLSPNSPYDNMYSKNVFKPKSPSTQSPRSRIKTTFAHKNVSPPQYFVFPTPPPVDNSKKPNFTVLNEPKSNCSSGNFSSNFDGTKVDSPTAYKRFSLESPKSIEIKTETQPVVEAVAVEKQKDLSPKAESVKNESNFNGIEKQLSLEEEIPMIDDSDLTNDIEFRTAKTSDKELNPEENIVVTPIEQNKIAKNQSFDDVKKELMADIPELDEFEKDLKENREKIINNAKENLKRVESENDSANNSMILDVNLGDLRAKYESLKESRKKLLSEIHEHKNKMSEIRAQEDDILRELEMEKALIKGEYDSEIAILNIEQKKRAELLERAKRIEDDIRCLKIKQEARQNEMKDRVEIATLKVERIEKDLSDGSACVEELQNAKDVLENETKLIEDLEFTQLEEETELLQAREDLQTELGLLTKKIDSQKTRILTLKSEANNNLTAALDETKILQAEYVRLLNEVEKLTTQVQATEIVLKPLVVRLNDLERAQSPDSAFYTDQTRAKSGDYGYSPQTSDSDEIDLTKMDSYTTHAQLLNDKFNSIDQMSQSMTVDIERREIVDIIDDLSNKSDSSPSKGSGKEKKGFWERNFDSLKRKKKSKPSDNKVDIMSQSLNENLIYDNEIENESNFDRFGSLRLSKSKKDKSSPLKCNSSSKIPTLSSITKIIKKDSFGKKNKDVPENDELRNNSVSKMRYTKNAKNVSDTNNKYSKKTTESDQQFDAKNKQNLIQHCKSKSFDAQSSSEPKNYHRKSCGDEPNVKISSIMKITDISMSRISDSGKVPSQDDIDRISKITLDAPIFTSDTDMNSLGKKTLDSLMEIERNRMVMLEEQGCQVIENEREKISELKRRAQNETKKLWDQKCKLEMSKSFDSNDLQCHSLSSDYDSLAMTPVKGYRGSENVEDGSFVGDLLNMTGSTVFEESSGLISASSIEELQVRNSRAESTEGKLSDDSRPISHASDLSRDQILSSSVRRNRQGIAPYPVSQRPLTRYLPQQRGDLDLRAHLYTAGHQVDLCPHVLVSTTTCRGYLHKLGAKFHTWSKRWFVFDRDTKTFVYYWDKTERKPRGGAYFQVIEEVYLDHGNTSRSPSPQTTFIVKTRQRKYHLLAPSSEAVRIWIDVIFTGAHSYQDYLE